MVHRRRPGWGRRLTIGALLAGGLVLARFWLGDDGDDRDGGRREARSVEERSGAGPEVPARAADPRDSEDGPGRRVALGTGEPLLGPEDAIDDEKRPRLLRRYGSEGWTVEDDLRAVEGTLQRFWIYFKDPDLLRLGSNASILEGLMGGNPEGIYWVDPGNRFIDAEGRLLDRWGTPLFFHARSVVWIETRSAGPDRELFTEDDVFVEARASTPLAR